MNETKFELMKKTVELCDEYKRMGRPLGEAFEKIAIDTGRAKGSIRNAYYAAIKRAETDEAYGIALFGTKPPSVAKIIEFDAAEARALCKKILLSLCDGKSVRRAIAEISPDQKTALRYQNKYRNMLVNDRSVVESVVAEIKRERGECFDPYKKVESDVLLNRLKYEINALYERVWANLRKENAALKSKVERLEKENAELRGLSGERDCVTKNYFEAIAVKPRKIEFEK